MQHGDPMRQLHDHLHVVLDDQDRQVLGDAAHQRHRVMGFGGAHPGGRLVEAEQPGLGRQRDADFEVALLAMREVGGQFVRLAQETYRRQHRLGLLDDVAIGAVVGQQAPAVPARLRGDADVFERGGVGEDVGDLIRSGDALVRDPVRARAR